MTSTGDNPIRPRFHMPLIAPKPADHQVAAPDYYAEVAQQCAIGVIPTAPEPELILFPGNPPDPKGLLVTLANPDAVFQYSGQIQTPPWRTLFAMTGGFLTYIRSTSVTGLNPWLPPPFDAIDPPFAPSTPTGLLTSQWGTLVLRLWSQDVGRMQDKLDAAPACGTLYYVGVAEDSLSGPVGDVVQRLYPTSRFDAAVAKGRQPTLLRVLEKIAGAPYSSAPSYSQLVSDYAARFIAGETSLLVEGGTPIGKTILTSAGGGTGNAGQVLLWALDSSATPAFAPVTPYFWSGVSSS